MTDFDAHTSDLVEASVDRAKVGANWPRGLAQLIEAHEKKHHGMVRRKQIHVLLDRYVERYFPGTVVEFSHRREVIQTVQRRYFDRLTVYMDSLRLSLRANPYDPRGLVREDYTPRIIDRPPGGWKFTR